MAVDSEKILEHIRARCAELSDGVFSIEVGAGDGYMQWLRFSDLHDESQYVNVRISPSHQIVETWEGSHGMFFIQGEGEIDDRVRWMVDCLTRLFSGDFHEAFHRSKLFGMVKPRRVIRISSSWGDEDMVLTRVMQA